MSEVRDGGQSVCVCVCLYVHVCVSMYIYLHICVYVGGVEVELWEGRMFMMNV